MIKNIFLNVMITLVLIDACHLFLVPKFEKKTTIKGYVFVFFLICLLALFKIPYINILSALIISVAILYLFKESFMIKGSYILIFYVCNAIVELLSIKFFSMVFMQDVFNTSYGFYLVFTTSNLVMLILNHVFLHFFRTLKLKEIQNNIWLLLLLPTTTLLIVFGFNDYYFIEGNARIFIILLLGLLLANISTFYVFHHSIQTIIKEKEIAQQNEIMKHELKQHEVFLHNVREQTTDMIKLLENQQYDKLNHYIQDIYSDTLQQYNLIHSNFEIIDVLIHDRLYIIKNNHINLRITLESTSFSTCSSLELGNFFKYLIDLGIHHCLTSNLEHPHFFIRSKERGNQVILSLTFTSLNKISETVVIQSIKEFIDRYQIIVSTDYDDTTNENILSFIF